MNGKWINCDCKCHFCGSKNTEYHTVTSSDEAFEDEQHRCKDCGITRWIDGIDS